MDMQNAKAVLDMVIFEVENVAVVDTRRLVLALQVVLDLVSDHSREELLKALDSLRDLIDKLR